jgi:putative addiction module component (TIGR02574 family)
MSTAQIRQRLHEIIDTAEDKKLKAIYTLLEDDSIDYQLSASQKKELDRRLHDHENGIGKTYTWDETILMAEQALAERKNNK